MSQTSLLEQPDLQADARAALEVASLSEVDGTAFGEIVGRLDGLGETAPEIVTALDAQPFAKYNKGSDSSSLKQS